MISARRYRTAGRVPSPIFSGAGAIWLLDQAQNVRSPTPANRAACAVVSNSGTMAGAFGPGTPIPAAAVMVLIMQPLPPRPPGVNRVQFFAYHRNRLTVIQPQSASQCGRLDVGTGSQNVLNPLQRFAQLLSDDSRCTHPGWSRNCIHSSPSFPGRGCRPLKESACSRTFANVRGQSRRKRFARRCRKDCSSWSGS